MTLIVGFPHDGAIETPLSFPLLTSDFQTVESLSLH
ncbi:hypothetical protein SLEP1_g8385 [Rubroshorea leprosula]|uniref:Agmatinase n=1 Tax=Rubroshorea leprosula TaxID=152421 RepID=A0AAV5IBB9_9ROSI|nr:hypothetical protein SLEP1_g8385 [Rubroshorea leprosula]